MTIINRFVNRKNELGFLTKEYKKQGFRFLSITGRRRVGKTALVENFILGKDALYLFVPDINDKELRLLFTKNLSEKFKLNFVDQTWDEIFDQMLSIEKKCIIVIDEFQRFLTINKSVPSILQKYIDRHHQKSRVFLITMGSSIGMMHRLFEYTAPLYGRRTGQIELEPLKFRHLLEWFPSVPADKVVEIYAIFGGTPKYLLEVDSKDIVECLQESILSKTGILYNEPEILARTELPDPSTYFNIMKLIAQGKTKMNEIADMISIKQTSLSYFLKVLEKDMGFVKKESPVTELKPKSKKTLYFINDNFINFWFRFVYPNMSYLEIENYSPVVDSVRKNMGAFVGKVFEDICKEFLIENKNILFSITNIGRWWNKNEEIDIVAFNKKTKEMLFCECKWKDNVDPDATINELKKRADYVELFKEDRKDYYAVFAKSFSKKSKSNVLLFDMKDIISFFKSNKEKI